MYTTPTLATRFARHTHVIRSEHPLAEDQMRSAAPSIFAEGKHASRSERYTYIPTIDVLRGLRKEGFEPFMVAQSKSRIEGKTEFTKWYGRLPPRCLRKSGLPRESRSDQDPGLHSQPARSVCIHQSELISRRASFRCTTWTKTPARS